MKDGKRSRGKRKGKRETANAGWAEARERFSGSGLETDSPRGRGTSRFFKVFLEM